MMFVIGIALFALAILVSVALHECGHMWVARATHMCPHSCSATDTRMASAKSAIPITNIIW